MGGDATLRCISLAPASRIILMSLRLVVPLTIESSTTTTRLPASVSATGLYLMRTFRSLSDCFGWMNVRPM